MTAVITTLDGLHSVLELDLVQARTQLAEARREKSRKDTPASRSAVAECLARIDALLDMYLQASSR